MTDRPPSTPPASAAAWAAVANLYHRAFTGLILTVVSRRSAADAGELMFRTFRHQHHAKFLSSLDKLGLGREPDAVKAAGYHYLANRIGGVKVEFMRESDTKAWVRFPPPRWVYDGVAICGVPTEVSRGMLRGWYAQNGVSLGNPRLGFVCTAQTPDGQHGLAGYFRDYGRDLDPEERLVFSPGEEPPPFDPAAAPVLPAADWPAERLAKASRNYAMEYIRSMLPQLAALVGPEEAGHLGRACMRLIGLQFYDETAAALGIASGGAAAFGAFLAALAAGQDDPVEVSRDGDAVLVRQAGWRLMRGAGAVHACVFEGWNGLWEGALTAHDRFLRLEVLERLDQGDSAFVWRIRPRGKTPVF